jgi:hypothetical protein
MAINLQKGQKIDIGLSKMTVGLGWNPNEGTGYDFDLALYPRMNFLFFIITPILPTHLFTIPAMIHRVVIVMAGMMNQSM